MGSYTLIIYTYILSLTGSARLDFSLQYFIEGEAKYVRSDEKSILNKTCQR